MPIQAVDYATPQRHPRFAWLGKASCLCVAMTVLCISAFFWTFDKGAEPNWFLFGTLAVFAFSVVGMVLGIMAILMRRETGYALLGLILNLIPLIILVWSWTHSR